MFIPAVQMTGRDKNNIVKRIISKNSFFGRVKRLARADITHYVSLIIVFKKREMTVPKLPTLIHFFDKIFPLLFDNFLGFCHQVEDSGFIRSFSYQLTTEGPKIPLRFVCRRRTHNLVDKTPTESCSNKLCIFSYVITLRYNINILFHLSNFCLTSG